MSEHNEKQLSIHHRLMRLNGLLHRRGHLMRMERGPMGDTTRGQGRVLTLLRMQPEISQKDLGYLLDMRPQSLGELLSKLEAAGYIERTPSEADRRAMDIRLTEQGRAAAEQAGERGSEMDALFDCLSEQEQRNLCEYLDKLIAALESQLGDERGEGDWDSFMRGHRPGDHGFFRGGADHGFGRGRDPRGYCRGGFGGHGGHGDHGGCGGHDDHRGGCGHERERPDFGPDGMRTDGEFREL